jgi:DNA polymerase-3 subunit gamma/tau
VLSVQDGILTLRFARDGDLKGFSTSGCDADLKRVLSAGFGLNVMVKGVVGGDQGGGLTPGTPGPGGGSDYPPAAARPEPVKPAATGHYDEPPDEMPPDEMLHDEPDDDEMPPDPPSSHRQAGRAPAAAELTGMDLIQRELGGQVISEIEG